MSNGCNGYAFAGRVFLSAIPRIGRPHRVSRRAGQLKPAHLRDRMAGIQDVPAGANDQKNEQKIKEFWCINLSAFGNTQGGVLIWGIGAKQIDKVDAAWSRPLVPSPDTLRTKLFELHHLATDPPLSGVEIEAITVPNEGGRGFVVCFVPQGAFVP